jgi:diguanylate cyclase (GGDEF)-like protein
MMTALPEKWLIALEKIKYAYQPIVSYASGEVLAQEALIRNVNEAGFESIDELFDTAYQEGILHQVEIELRKKAIKKFLKYRNPYKNKLFLNIDSRVLQMHDYLTGKTAEFLKELNISPAFVTFEISEKHHFDSFFELKSIVANYKKQHYSIAIDDYGVGFSGLELLYHVDADYIKVDRFFIHNIHKDFKKRLLLNSLVTMVHTLGIAVIAEGVETKEEFVFCKEIGVDAVQGYYVEKPSLELKGLPYIYASFETTFYQRQPEHSTLLAAIVKPPSVHYKALLSDVFEMLRRCHDYPFLVIVDDYKKPLGVLHDKLLKKYIYSPFGASLLTNKTIYERFNDLVTPYPVATLQDSLENIMAFFSYYHDIEGIIMTENQQYYGILPVKALIAIVHEQRLVEAMDQNPLTKLPGNRSIEVNLQAINRADKQAAIIYFDLNSFKAFNDYYGFRNGDRIIMLLANLLIKFFDRPHFFVGHIGGDDFVVSVLLSDRTEQEITAITTAVVNKFADDALAFYSREDQQRGYIRVKDRHGEMQDYPLVTVSAALLFVSEYSLRYRQDYPIVMAALKSTAKTAIPPIASAYLL